MSSDQFSYRNDPDVPDFDDSRPLFIFDHVCVLCSGGVSFIMKHDKKAAIAFTSAQGELGEHFLRIKFNFVICNSFLHALLKLEQSAVFFAFYAHNLYFKCLLLE